MIFIDLDDFSPDIGWLNRAEELTEELKKASTKKERDEIIDKNDKEWGKLKESLLDLSHRKCWYSESKETYSYYHVDHFRPKKVALDTNGNDQGGYWWLAFNWKNYRISGGVGNVIKRDKFAVKKYKANTYTDNIDDEIIYLLDPLEEEDILKITFNSNGEMIPLYQKGNWSYEQAEYTIKTLNLNFKLLTEARKELWNKCHNLLEETQNLMNEHEASPSPLKRGQIKEKMKQIRALIRPTSEFSTTAKACLRSTGFEWALQITV